MNDDTNITVQASVADPSFEACMQLVSRMDRNRLEGCYGSKAKKKRVKLNDSSPLNMLLSMALSPSMHRILASPVSIEERFGDSESMSQPHCLLEMDAQVQKAFETFGRDFPTAIWTCCARRCFARAAILPECSAVFNAVLRIHRGVESLHDKMDGLAKLVRTRKRGPGRSSIVHAPKQNPNQESRPVTDRQHLQRMLKDFIIRSLPFLRAEIVAPDGTPPPRQPFCIEATCQILGIQHNTLYKPVRGQISLIDNAGSRQRKFRRIGSRKGYRDISELSAFECGCEVPCFAGLSEDTLQRLWERFKILSAELSPEEKENRYLMNQMFCPLTNNSVRVCNAAIGELYTISEALVGSIRLLVHQMCEDPALQELPIREHGMKRYRARHHPLNRFPPEVIEQVERHLDMTLRPDPAAADGTNVCRVYSPEINTQEKLRRMIADSIGKDFREIRISPTSLQRMVKSYLEARGCRVSFSQADHNACPMCKSFHHEILYLDYEKKQLSERIAPFLPNPRPMLRETQERWYRIAAPLIEEKELKEYREGEATSEMKEHNERDARIRGWLKRITDHLRTAENNTRQNAMRMGVMEPFGWCQRRNFALVTHQDDMTKVDLPHFVVDASADITRWRFDVNAHVNAVTGDCVVLSHEQGAGSKNSSSIIELILMDHILTCKGENIKIVVSDNASVGKNWLSTVAFPQYIVDQGLADIVLIVFLENNHGKWLADMLFGQFQIRKRNSTILGVDGLLQEFETINRPRGGRLTGYAVNPLGCVDFAQVFAQLGYETKPPKEFGFKNRNIHFACACKPESKERLSPELKNLLVNALPEEEGMVRLCSEPPNFRSKSWRKFEDRWLDVPAASRRTSRSISVASHVPNTSSTEAREPPLAIPIDKTFAANGPGVVSKRTAERVGFNGLTFRGNKSFPELVSESYITREAWPPGLLRAGDPGYESESLRCAPENWLLRRPVRHYGRSGNAKARYPPRNLLNSLYSHGPRATGVSIEPDETVFWIPTATYSEPPFPIDERRSATEGLRALGRYHRDITKDVNFLEVLRFIYQEMGDRQHCLESWLQKPATRPSPAAFERYDREIRIVLLKDAIRPQPVKTLLQAFREDSAVQLEIEAGMEREGQRNNRTTTEIVASLFEARMMRNAPERLAVLRRDMERYETELRLFSEEERTKRAVTREQREQEKQISQSRSKVVSRLFEKSKLKPGAVDRFRRLVEEDKQRHAREVKLYRDGAIVKFEEDHELLPIQGPLPDTQS